MENSILQAEILKNLDFLKSQHSFLIIKNEPHWLGGVIIQYKKEDYIFSILYDKREQWFVSKFFSAIDENKTHMYIVGELRKFCPSLQSPMVSIENDEEIISFLKSFKQCLKDHFDSVFDNFIKGDYFGGKHLK